MRVQLDPTAPPIPPFSLVIKGIIAQAQPLSPFNVLLHPTVLLLYLQLLHVPLGTTAQQEL
jgi:hypothetical protein